MGRGRHGKQSIQATQSRSEGAVANPVSSRHRHELSNAPTGRERTAKRCPSLDRCVLHRFQPEALTQTERVLSIAEHPLADFQRIVSRWEAGGKDGAPPLTERFIMFIDREPSASKQRALAILESLSHFALAYPTLYMILVEHVDMEQSQHAIGAQLGLDHKTVAGMIRRARMLVRESLGDEVQVSA